MGGIRGDSCIRSHAYACLCSGLQDTSSGGPAAAGVSGRVIIRLQGGPSVALGDASGPYGGRQHLSWAVPTT